MAIKRKNNFRMEIKEISADGSFTADLDTLDPAADEALLQPASNGLHLRQLGHDQSSEVMAAARLSARHASAAAACSASFFDRPSPWP